MQWSDVNFFDNPFSEDVGDLLFGCDVYTGEMDLSSPDNTSDGVLRKRWKILDGRRCLLKTGTDSYQQEPYNEVIASKVMESMDIPHVDYALMTEHGRVCSVCPDFVDRDTELITASRIFETKPKDNRDSGYEHLVGCCQDLGVDIIPFLDRMLVGYMVRESLILEFCSTMVALILAGKMGSNIASEIGSMRISEQIDAMDMMGINSAGYLVLPKIISSVLLSPFLMLLSMALGILGGYVVVELTEIIPTAKYVSGLRYSFNGFYIFYSCFKMSLFCFFISSISAFNGYYARGGSLGVGWSSTRSIVVASILILMFDLIVTQLMLY